MTTYEIEDRSLAEQRTAVATATLPVDEIGPWLAEVYGTVAGVLAAQGAGPAGPPFARYHRLDDGRFEIEAGFPATRPIDDRGEVTGSRLPGGPAVFTVHLGPYDDMEPAYDALADSLRHRERELAGDMWEVYFSDPATEPDPATWRTEIFAPYRDREG